MMCTAISYWGARHLFGRTLDVPDTYGEELLLTPRQYALRPLHEAPISPHLALLGIGCVQNGTPLYYDAINEAGLAAAALNFPHYAVYAPPERGARCIASFEVIPLVLAQCRTVAEAAALLQGARITDDVFSPQFPPTPLHWLIADRKEALTVEATERGVELYPNPYGILTNSPPFPYHEAHLLNYLSLDASPAPRRLYPDCAPQGYSNGTGAVGLPGDYTSPSRFVRAAFLNALAVAPRGEDPIGHFFRLTDAVSIPRGAVKNGEDKEHFTVYTSCGDTTTATYYVSTYQCRRIRALTLSDFPLDGSALFRYPLDAGEDVRYLNK